VKLIAKKILPLLLLLIINAYQINILLFTHVHYVNGIPVAHSHPNHGQHSHPDGGLLFIAFISSFHSLKPENYSGLDLSIYSIIKTVEFINQPTLFKNVYLKIPSLRAPPSFVC
jgi:hypothetical protein